MRPLLFLLFLAAAVAQEQINFQVEIDNADPISPNSLSAELTEANLQQATITQTVDQVILIDICQAGTFSVVGATSCTNCPAGTASNTLGADTAMACHACNAGTWANSGFANCSKCVTNHFSPTYKAEIVTRCLTCPPHSTSPIASPQVQSCVCDDGYFQSDNLLPVFDGILVSLGFESAAAVNVPHVSC